MTEKLGFPGGIGIGETAIAPAKTAARRVSRGELAAASGRWRVAAAAAFEREMERGRGALWLPVAFALGILLYRALPREPALPALAAGLAAAIVAAWRARHAVGAFRLLLMLCLVAAGATAMKIRTDLVSTPMLAADWTGELTGWVERVEPTGPNSRRLTLRVRTMEEVSAEATPGRVRVTMRARMDHPRVGDGLGGLVSLQAARGPVVPGGYDFDRAAFHEGIGASGFSYGAMRPADLDPPPPGLRLAMPLEDLRRRIGLRIETALPGPTGEIANALVTGERGGIPAPLEDALRDSGLYHIISISGLHMALVAAVAFGAIRGTLALFPAIALRRPIKKWAAAGALVVTTLYLALSGAEVATQRSYVMLAIMLVAILLDRRAFSVRNVAVAAMIVLLVQPEALFTASFQMSFAATLALVAGFEAIADRNRERDRFTPPRGRLAGWIGRWLAFALVTSILAGLATAPFSAFHFQRTAPLSLLANLAADLPVAILVMPPALAAVALMPFGLEAPALWLMDLGLQAVLRIAEAVARWSGESGLVPMFSTTALLLIVAGLLWLSLWRESWRLAGFVPIVAGVILAAAAPRPALIVAPSGEAAAVRGPDGGFRTLAAGAASFETEIWLRSDADPRAVRDASLRDGVLCDPLGCMTFAADGSRVALVLDRRAFAEDCRRAAIVISALDAPRGCAAPLIIDRAVLRTGGAVALYSSPGVTRSSPGVTGTPAATANYRLVPALPFLRRPGMPPAASQ